MPAHSLLPSLDAVFKIMKGEVSLMARSENLMKIDSASLIAVLRAGRDSSYNSPPP